MQDVAAYRFGQGDTESARRSFRDVLGRYATGVVLVTARTEHGPAGMAVNSFTSVSLEPPLVALCAAHSSTTWPLIREVGAFAVAILGAGHEELCRRFARRGADRFGAGSWQTTPAGHPVPADALAWLDCAIASTQPAGDHDLVLARALAGSTAHGGDPLVFHAGRFTGLAP